MTRKLTAFGLGIALLLLASGFFTGGIAFSQTPGQGLKATWSLPNPPTEGRVGLRLVINNLELNNSGSLTWPKGGNQQLRLAYRWFNAANQPLDPKNPTNGYDELRADLPQDIPPGGRLLYPQFVVGVPNAPGDYSLHIDLVQGANTYLASQGSPDLSLKIKITGKDTTPPVAAIQTLPVYANRTLFNVSWSGKDEDGGSGLINYDVQYRVVGEADWRDWLLNTTATSARFQGENGKIYLFRTRARDAAGNLAKYPDTEQASTRVDSLPPAVKVESLPAQSPAIFLVRWSSFDNVSGAAAALCDIQYREGNAGPWLDWQVGSSVGSALFRGEPGKSYAFRARATDYAGNIGDYPQDAQATTQVSAALNLLTNPAIAAPVVTDTNPPAPQSVFLPYVAKNGENAAGTSTVLVYNPGSAPIDVFVRFNAGAGAPLTRTVTATQTITNPQGVASQQVVTTSQDIAPDTAAGIARVETALRTVQPGETVNLWAGIVSPASYEGWVEIRSAGKFEAGAIRQPLNGLSVLNSPSSSGTSLFLPYIKKGDALNSSYLNIANPSATPAQFTITYYDPASGNVVATDQRTLPRFGSVRFSASSIPTGDPNLRFVGTAVISSSAALAASVETPLEDGTPLYYTAATKALQVAPQLPVYKDADGVTSAVLVQNAGKDLVTVKLEYLDAKGDVVATREQNLAGFGRLIAWQGDVKELSAGFSGKVRVSTAAQNGALAVTVVAAGPNFKDKLFL